MVLFKTIGVIGLLAIIVGILLQSRERRNYLYIFGGVCLTAYSVYIQDFIFIVLQVTFTLVALYDYMKIKSKKKKKKITS